MTSKALFTARLIALGSFTMIATACPGEPDPEPASGTETETEGTTTSTTIPDECGTGGAFNDYCCEFNSNYCSTDTDTDTDTNPLPPDTDTNPPPPDTDTDTGDTLAGCACIIDEAEEGGSPTVPSLPTCGEQLCGDVSGSCDGWCDEVPFELSSPEALECALVALRDRTPGIVTWSWAQNGGQYDDDGYVLINADGTAVRRSWGWSDLSYQADAAALGELPPAEHFDACLADPDDRARFDCMRGALDSTLGVCDEGWSYSKG